MATSTVENYLKAILQISEKSDHEVTVGQIATELAVTPGSVSAMMRHLSDEGLIVYQPRRSVTLLPAGRDQALQIVRRHRLIETFLVKVMKFDWAEVHTEAEALEHVISDHFLQRMDELLGHPSNDPHGDPIPDAEGNFTPQENRHLAEVELGHYRISRVDDSDPALLDWLKNHQLMPGRTIHLTRIDPVMDILEITVNNSSTSVQVGHRAAQHISVTTIN